jgi:hypothetical protein
LDSSSPQPVSRRSSLHRNLRIAWSIGCGILALALIALWLRSYWRLDILEKRTGLQAVQVSSVKGRCAIAHLESRAAKGQSFLSFVAGDAADWRKGGTFGFACFDDGLVKAVVVPHWLPALLLTVFAVIPWFSRSWRFSLRTLLIATAVVAAALGAAVVGLRAN